MRRKSQECDSTADVKQMTKTLEQQQLSDAPEPAVKEEPAVQLDEAPLDETQPVVQSPREDRISRAVRLELERLQFEKGELGHVDSDVPELYLLIEHLTDVAVFSGTSAWKPTNSWFTTRRDPCSVCSSDRIRFSNFRCLCSKSASERVCSARTSHPPSRTLTAKRCGQLS